MNKLKNPKKAWYKHYSYDRLIRNATQTLSEVEIIEESDNKFKIKLLDNENKIITVDKSTIIFHTSAVDI